MQCPISMGTTLRSDAPVVDLLKSLHKRYTHTHTHTYAFLFKGVNKRREKRDDDEGCAAA